MRHQTSSGCMNAIVLTSLTSATTLVIGYLLGGSINQATLPNKRSPLSIVERSSSPLTSSHLIQPRESASVAQLLQLLREDPRHAMAKFYQLLGHLDSAGLESLIIELGQMPETEERRALRKRLAQHLAQVDPVAAIELDRRTPHLFLTRPALMHLAALRVDQQDRADLDDDAFGLA